MRGMKFRRRHKSTGISSFTINATESYCTEWVKAKIQVKTWFGWITIKRYDISVKF